MRTYLTRLENDKKEIAFILHENGKQSGYYRIERIMNGGASSVAYDAIHFNSRGERLSRCVIKEFNPIYIDSWRTLDGKLQVKDAERERFDSGLVRFERAFELQRKIGDAEFSGNTTSFIQDKFNVNGTCYISMPYMKGDLFSDKVFQGLYDLIRTIKAIATVIAGYHKAGYLMLDIKPDNIYLLPDTLEMIKFFDFDSIVKKEELGVMGTFSYTEEWAAPELIMPQYRNNISERTDIYSLGELLYWKMFKRHSQLNEKRGFGHSYEEELRTQGVSGKVIELLKDFFDHTINLVGVLRYENMNVVLRAIDELLEELAPKKYELISSEIYYSDYYLERQDLLKEIKQLLNEEKRCVLCGVGGIGKSTLAREYARLYRNEYDKIIFAIFEGNLLTLVINDGAGSCFQITNFERESDEKDVQYYDRKMKKLRELCNAHILLILDNLDSRIYEEENLKVWNDLKQLGCHIILTTRGLRNDEFSKINIAPMSKEQLQQIFALYYMYDKKQEIMVDSIIEKVGGLTLAVELIAKECGAGFFELEEMNKKLEYGIENVNDVEIALNKDQKPYYAKPIEILMDIFEEKNLTESMRLLLRQLAFMPTAGVNVRVFLNLFKDIDIKKNLNELQKRGWIDICTGELYKQIIRMSPVIAETIIYRFKTDKASADEFWLEMCVVSDRSFENGFGTAERMVLLNVAHKVIRNCVHEKSACRFVHNFWVDNSNYCILFGQSLYMNMMEWVVHEYERNQYGNETDRDILMYNLAGIYGRNEENEKALKLIDDGLKKNIDNRIRWAQWMMLKGQSLEDIGEISKAESCYKKSIEYCSLLIKQKQYNKVICNTYISYGLLLAESIFDLPAAYEKYRVALDMYGKKSTKETLDISEQHNRALGYNRMSSCCIYLERYEEAEGYLQKAELILKEIKQDETIEMAVTYEVMGDCSYAKGKYEQAEKYYKQAVCIGELMGEREKMDFICDLGMMKNQRRDLDALRYNLDLLKQAEKLKIRDSELLSALNCNVAEAYYIQSEIVRAEHYAEQAINVYEKGQQGKKNIRMLIIYELLCKIKIELEDFESAQKYVEELVFLTKTSIGENTQRMLRYKEWQKEIKSKLEQ